MRSSTIISSFLFGGALALGGVLLAPSFAGEDRAAPAAERQWLSIPQVHEKLEAAGYRHVEKIERERGGYEARATDRDGERIKLYVNPQTGEIVDQRRYGSHAKRYSESQQRYSSGATECNKRRCRDDIPQASATPVTK
jgi:hypothetical protein